MAGLASPLGDRPVRIEVVGGRGATQNCVPKRIRVRFVLGHPA